nr:hypothetical protein B0A51_08919 [Rachicladosporium sp. CCFEE 5018]
MSTNLPKSSKLLALPPDIRAQIWDQVLTPWTIHFRHVSLNPIRFRASLCTVPESDKQNAFAPAAARKTYIFRHRACQAPVSQALRVLLTCRSMYTELSKLVFIIADFVLSSRFLLISLVERLTPWQAASMRRLTLCDAKYALYWGTLPSALVVTCLLNVRHLSIYVELTYEHYDGDESTVGGNQTVHTQSDRDERLAGIHVLRALKPEMWIADWADKDGENGGEWSTVEQQEVWIERVRGILLGGYREFGTPCAVNNSTLTARCLPTLYREPEGDRGVHGHDAADLWFCYQSQTRVAPNAPMSIILLRVLIYLNAMPPLQPLAPIASVQFVSRLRLGACTSRVQEVRFNS